MKKLLVNTETSWKEWISRESNRRSNKLSIVDMAEKEKQRKLRFCVGDEGVFVLSPHAEFSKLNCFEGTIVKVIPKDLELRVIVAPKHRAQLAGWCINQKNEVLIPFRCFRITNMLLHNALTRKQEASIRMKRSLEKLYLKHGNPNQKKKKEKSGQKWDYIPGSYRQPTK